MAKEILRFKGLSLNRDEQSAQHGELSVCAGLELHDGALRPSVLEGTMVQHDVSGTATDSVLQVKVSGADKVTTLLYVHETASYRHFIGEYNKSLYWFNEDGTVGSPLVSTSHVPIHTFTGANDAIVSVNSIGNTLIVLAKSGIHYIRWKDDAYKYLGDEIPFVDINFRPSARKITVFDNSTVTTEAFEPSDDVAARQIDMTPNSLFSADSEHSQMAIYDDKEATVTEAIWALINQTNNTIAKDGNFYAPFFIRYCYRLYDGSLVMHSAPVFMDVALPRSYYVSCANLSWTIGPGDSHIYHIDSFEDIDVTVLTYEPNNVGIRYSISNLHHNLDRLTSLKNDWKDIVKSIDVFVSPMMTREISGDKIKTLDEDNDVVYWGIRDTDLFEQTYSTEQVKGFYANIPLIDEKEYLLKLKNCSTFYKLMSFNLETDTITADGTYRDLEYKKEIVPNITSQELMKDDYHTHCKMSPMDVNRGMYIYNHRLNLYGMNEKLFEGFLISSMINTYSTQNVKYIYKAVVELHTEEGTKYVVKDCHNEECPVLSICNSLLFYPDSRATQMTLYFCDSGGTPTGKKLVLKMENSNFMNGAVSAQYFYQSSFDNDLVNVETGEPPVANDLVPMRNKVLTSEVDDPYYFPIEGRNTVGIGAIVGLAAVTRALSQGQVGDHDLIAFCTDGIWVMKVSGEGTYSAVHNISREVCTNPKSICQLDQSVVFATQRSLSRFVESNVISMSEVLDGPVKNWSSLFGTFFSNIEPIARQLNFFLPAAPNSPITPIDMFNKGSVFYDYAGDRVVVLPEDTSQASVALVFSIRDQAWATMPIPAIMAVVPGYPSPFVQLGDGKVMILDKPYNYRSTGDNLPGLILTRELTFSDTMDVIRGYQHYAECGTAPTLFIFGSNDQRNWIALGNSNRWYNNYLPGRSFRFFRIAIYTQMKPSEEYQQLLLEIVNKYGKL